MDGDGDVVVGDIVAVGGVADGGHDGVEGVDEGEEVEVFDIQGGFAGGVGGGAGVTGGFGLEARRLRSVAASLNSL